MLLEAQTNTTFAEYTVVAPVAASIARTPVARLRLAVVDHVGHDLERLERQTPRGRRGRQPRRLRAEVGAVWAAEPARVVILASPAARQRPRQVGDAAGNESAAAAELFRQAPGRR